MTKLSMGVLCAAALVAGACKQSDAPPSKVVVDDVRKRSAAEMDAEILARTIAFKDQMCACTAKPCVDEVTKEYARWSAETDQRVTPASYRPAETMLVKAMEAADVYDGCKRKVLGQQQPAQKVDAVEKDVP